MGNQQSSRTNTYQQYYNSLKNNEPIQLPSNITPYEILGLNKNFSWDELKDAYKRQAKLVHPDKGGTEQLFNLVTEAFKKLAYEYKLKEQDKQHYELKKNYQHQQPLKITTNHPYQMMVIFKINLIVYLMKIVLNLMKMSEVMVM